MVTNILPYLRQKISVEEFIFYLFENFVNHTNDACRYRLGRSDSELVMEIARHKYHTWEWIYGYSPKYRFENQFKIEDREIGIHLEVENGMINTAAISGDFLNTNEKRLLADALIQQRHDDEQVRKTVNHIFMDQLHSDKIECIVEGFF